MPKITKDNSCDIECFIKDNLSEFNRNPKAFEFNKIKQDYEEFGYDGDDKNIITATKIRKKLNENYRKLIEDPNKKDKLEDDLKQLKSSNVVDANEEMQDIALQNDISIKNVQNHYKKIILEVVKKGFEKDQDKLEKVVLNRLLNYANAVSNITSELPGEYIKKDFKTCIHQAAYWLLNMGFSQNLTNEVKGQDVANQGDSAQFMFVGRAILAGYNCSNVDVRSSSFDAIISKPNSNGKGKNIKTVQIKGITTGRSLPLTKRARGGSGSTQEGRNIAENLSPEDADFLVAVDKLFGTCYIIPMGDVEAKIQTGKKSISWKQLETNYKEKWEYINK